MYNLILNSGGDSNTSKDTKHVKASLWENTYNIMNNNEYFHFHFKILDLNIFKGWTNFMQNILYVILSDSLE